MRKMKKSKVEAPRPSRVVAYIRVSTSRQVQEGHSLEAQRAQLEAYAAMRGLEVVAFETDAGLSASSLERPGLQRALERLDRFEANGLLVVKLDRLTRSVRDFSDLVDTYFRDGTHALMSVNESIDTSTAAGRLVLNVLMLFSQWEREAAAERTAVVMERLRETGRFSGGWPPYGWAVNEDGALVANPEEQVIIARARDLKTQGRSLRSIAAELGLNPRTSKSFDAKAVMRMIDGASALEAA